MNPIEKKYIKIIILQELLKKKELHTEIVDYIISFL